MRKAASDGYPPYNIEQTGEDRLRITIAVAGFTMDDLEIELDNNQLTIRGKQGDGYDEEKVYLHRGIASRQFQRSFVLADGIEITGATLDNGLLHIDMKRIQPESQARKIEITSADADNAGKNAGNTAQAIDVEDKSGETIKD